MDNPETQATLDTQETGCKQKKPTQNRKLKRWTTRTSSKTST